MAVAEHSRSYRSGCRCEECRETHRVDEMDRRRRRGILPRHHTPAVDRFWQKVCQTEDCWLWTGSLDSSGYGMMRLHSRKQVKAHRFSYELLVGPIPEEKVVDHLCRVRNCVNPDHLEPVTHAENMRRSRRTHCRRGHELTSENVYVTRMCKACFISRKEERVAV